MMIDQLGTKLVRLLGFGRRWVQPSKVVMQIGHCLFDTTVVGLVDEKQVEFKLR